MPVRQPTEAERQIMLGVEEAKQARLRFQSVYNTFYDLAAPWRTRINEQQDARNPRSPAEQDDIFDTTLQNAVDDWSSDCADEFTPSYKDWAKYKVVGGPKTFSKSVQEKILELATAHFTTIYDRIRESAFEEQSQEAYVDFAIGPMAMDWPETKAGQPLKCEHVPISELLVLPAPYGGGPGDRFRVRDLQVKHLDVMWPKADWSHLGTKAQRKISQDTIEVVQAHTRDWENRSEEVWTYQVLCKGIAVTSPQVTRGPGSCRLVVARPRVSAPSAIGIGFANKALAPARTLNKLAYLELKRQGKIVDPPTGYSDDGTANVEGGVDAGTWIEFGEGFVIQELAPQTDAREVWFNQEDLRMQVKQALFQDKPYQRGDTPPTAAQWLSEEERNARRKGFPRARAIREWVLPTLRRVEWMLRKRGEVQDQRIEGELIRFEPISPMSRASDLGEVQLVNQFIDLFIGRLPESAINLNLTDTMKKVAELLGTDAIVLRTAEEVEQQQMKQAAMAAAERGQIPGAGQQ